MIVLSVAMIVIGIIVSLLLWFKLSAKVVFTLVLLSAGTIYWKITMQEYIEFGSHVDIESWKVAIFCVAVLLIETTAIILIWKFLHRHSQA